ncbi:TRAP transporter small permease [Amorphus sp. 3PC139-8]|uniref:TRAP transporter small permease n=1 Tax=Amorphus sp. 3PC139-8 TaxID=2735676 RepID=UPI00345DF3FF
MKALLYLSRGLFVLSAWVCLPSILVVLACDVTLRYFFDSPIRWAQELAEVLLFLSVVLALPESFVRHAHVKADFLKNVLGRAARESVIRLKWALALAICVLIIRQCWADAEYMLLIQDSTPELYVPMAWLRGALALGAAGTAAIALVRLLSPRRLVAADGEEAPLDGRFDGVEP